MYYVVEIMYREISLKINLEYQRRFRLVLYLIHFLTSIKIIHTYLTFCLNCCHQKKKCFKKSLFLLAKKKSIICNKNAMSVQKEQIIMTHIQ